jgi:hypothetical protein
MPTIVMEGVIDSVQVTGRIFNPPGFPLANNTDILATGATAAYTMPSKYRSTKDTAIIGVALLSGTDIVTGVSSSNGQSGAWSFQTRTSNATNGLDVEIWTAPVTATTTADVVDLTFTASVEYNIWGDSRACNFGSYWSFTAGISISTADVTTIDLPSITAPTTTNPLGWWGLAIVSGTASASTTSGYSSITSTVSGNVEVYNNVIASGSTPVVTAPSSPGFYQCVGIVLENTTTPPPPNPPSVTGVSPGSGINSGGTTVVINGNNLATTNAVKFGTVAAASFSGATSTSVNAISPAGTAGKTVDVRVTTPVGTSPIVTGDEFTYTSSTNPSGQSPPVVGTTDPATGWTWQFVDDFVVPGPSGDWSGFYGGTGWTPNDNGGGGFYGPYGSVPGNSLMVMTCNETPDFGDGPYAGAGIKTNATYTQCHIQVMMRRTLGVGITCVAGIINATENDFYEDENNPSSSFCTYNQATWHWNNDNDQVTAIQEGTDATQWNITETIMTNDQITWLVNGGTWTNQGGNANNPLDLTSLPDQPASPQPGTLFLQIENGDPGGFPTDDTTPATVTFYIDWVAISAP